MAWESQSMFERTTFLTSEVKPRMRSNLPFFPMVVPCGESRWSWWLRKRCCTSFFRGKSNRDQRASAPKHTHALSMAPQNEVSLICCVLKHEKEALNLLRL